jgi:hypothetical protein
MSNWKVRIDVSDYFYPDDPMHSIRIKDDHSYFKEIRNKIVHKLDEHENEIKNTVKFHEYDTYKDLKHYLEKSNNLNKFNEYWSYLYDWADDNLIWINTYPGFKKEKKEICETVGQQNN